MDDELTKARYQFQKALKKFVNKYREKGLNIESVEIEWGNIKEDKIK